MFVKHNYKIMEFIDRIEEQKRLKRVLNNEQSSFVVIYGRRRIGKSTLIKKVLSESDIYFMADRSEQPLQREMMANVVADIIPGFNLAQYPTWEALISTLNQRCENKFTLCLDEFPFLVEHSPELPSILQKLIDSKNMKFNLVICGSSQQMMEKAVLDATEPLYGRADAILKMKPIALPFLKEALNTTDIATFEEYSVWGGVPRYWILREKETNIESAIEYHIFHPNGILYDEPNRLFIDDLAQSTQSETLLSVIAGGSNRISEIAARMGKKATDLGRPLKKLINLGFLYKEVPFGEDENNSKKSLYKIADPFMDFYYTYVVPNRSLIGLGRTERVIQKMNMTFSSYTGQWWEYYCRQAISGQDLFGSTWQFASRWWGSVLNSETKTNESIELDVVAMSDNNRKLLVGECKWTEGEYAERLFNMLQHKASLLPFAKNKEVEFVLFLKSEIIDEDFIVPENCHILYPKDVIGLL